MQGSIIVPLDGSSFGEQALPWAFSIARRAEAPVHLVHVHDNLALVHAPACALACSDPEAMLEFLRGKASDRKLRLFAVACCRGMSHFGIDAACAAAVETSERFADGAASVEQLRSARRTANRSRWAITRVIGRSGCSSRPRLSSSGS